VRNCTLGSVWPWLSSKLRGSLSAAGAGVPVWSSPGGGLGGAAGAASGGGARGGGGRGAGAGRAGGGPPGGPGAAGRGGGGPGGAGRVLSWRYEGAAPGANARVAARPSPPRPPARGSQPGPP